MEYGIENPEGIWFLTCLPISMILESLQIAHTIIFGDAPEKKIVNRYGTKTDYVGTISDPIIRHFNLCQEST